MFGRNILILIPHPDDEVVGCCAAIGRARARGARVHGLYLSTGVPAADVLWPWQRRHHGARVARRRTEAAAVANDLGLLSAGQADVPTRHVRDGLPEARAAVAAAVEQLGIDMLWAPAWEGGHQDHDAANAIAATFIARMAVFEFAEYTLAGGRVRANRFPDEGAETIVLRLDAAEKAVKRRMLALYPSERLNLHHVDVEREAFRPLPPRDYDQPPHPGRLFRERFHWVPVRHPGIDDTPSAEVRRTCAAFVARSRGEPTGPA